MTIFWSKLAEEIHLKEQVLFLKWGYVTYMVNQRLSTEAAVKLSPVQRNQHKCHLQVPFASLLKEEMNHCFEMMYLTLNPKSPLCKYILSTLYKY